MRTDDEIVAFYRKRSADDFLGTIAEEVLTRLSADRFREFAKPDADLSDWKPSPRDRDFIISEMREYMPFAWEKALGHRGLSAGRSIDHIRAWLFLLEDDESLAFADNGDNYPRYGAPILMYVCEKYGITAPESDDAINMAGGEPCSVYCEDGCGQ